MRKNLICGSYIYVKYNINVTFNERRVIANQNYRVFTKSWRVFRR
jgi:hypothetical protein